MADVQKPNNEASVAKQDRVRLTLLVHRKPGLSLGEFQKYWREQHAGVFTGIAIVKKNLLSYQQVCKACNMSPQYWALGRLICRPLSLQAHVDEGVSISHPMVLQSIQDRSPKISFGRRNLMVAARLWLGPLEAMLTWRLYVDVGTTEASRLPCSRFRRRESTSPMPFPRSIFQLFARWQSSRRPRTR